MAGYKLLLDVPSSQPALGFNEIADGLRDLISESEARFAVGIFGGWGSGKSTLMAAIRRKLHRDYTVAVEFNAWRYEREEHLIVPLLDHVREALIDWADERPGAVDAERARHTASTIGKAVRSLIAGMSVRFGLPGAVELSFDANRSLAAGKQISEEELNSRVPRSFYHASFAALRGAFDEFSATGSNQQARRIVVFVDDLDRCLPDKALEVLESMKLFFDLPGFVFVVGLDKQIIERAVETKYPPPANGADRPAASAQGHVTGTEYVKKIFQLPYRLQPVGISQLDEFLERSYDEANVETQQREELKTLEPHLEYIVQDGTVNPREIKRYINLYTLQTKVDSDDSLNRSTMQALQTVAFRDDWYDIYSALLQFGPALTDALNRRIAGDARALEALDPELAALNPEFLRYTAPGQPGNALLQTPDLDRYIFAGEAVRSTQDTALLEAIRKLGQIRTMLRDILSGARNAGETLATVKTDMAAVESHAAARAQQAALGPNLAAFRDEVTRLHHLVAGDPKADLPRADIEALERPAGELSRLLLRIYRSGDVGSMHQAPA